MTTRYQRLDPIWRAFAYRREPLQGGKRRDEFQRLWRGAALAALLTAPAMAYAAGAPQPQEAPPPQEAPAQAESAPAAAPKEPAPPRGMGMVRYSKPVFHNGHLVLWHGAWRGGGGVRMQSGEAAPAKPAAPTGASAAAAAKSRDFLILADGADAAASRMAGEFAAAVQGDDIHVKAIAGKTSTPALEKIVSSDSADLAIIPMDGLLDKGEGAPRDRTPYLARLANEPIALITSRSIADISQLAGRKMNVEAADGATAATAALVFSRLNIAPTMTNERLPDALTRLAHGQIDAIFVVGASESKALADLGKDGQFHIIPIAYYPTLQGLYSPMRLTSRDQPNLIGADEKIDTIGVPMALVAIDAAPNSPRADRIAPLSNLLFEQYDRLFAASGNSNWKTVNLAARIAGWPRLSAAQAWLDQNKGASDAALETFRSLAQTASVSGDGPSGADSDRLYESLMQASRAAQ